MAKSTRLPGSILRVDRLPTGQRRLVRELAFEFDEDLGIPPDTFQGFDVVDGRTRVTVPACFVTDFSSIPSFARPLYRFSTVDLAGVCHDWAYRMGVDRRKADRCWRIVATSGTSNVGPTRGYLGYLALRLGGWAAFKSNRAKRESGIVCDPRIGGPCTCTPCGDSAAEATAGEPD